MSAPQRPLVQPIPAGATVVTPDMLPQGVHSTSQNLLYNNNNETVVHNQQPQPQHPYGVGDGIDIDQPPKDSIIGNEQGGLQDELDDESSEAGGTEDIQSDCSGEEPIKLFVGQVPRSMEEADLFPIFEKYGPMEDVAIIRDKHTGQHRGCAFVTFFSKESADACENDLHNKFIFEGGKRAVQIRPAGRKEEVDNKVFVGMLPRNVAEETVRELFAPYGEIKGIFLIRSSDGIKKGCAFVKYNERESALAAIRSLHGATALQGSDRPLIVKIADTKTQRKQRHTYQQHGVYTHETPLTHSPQGSFNGNVYYMPTGHGHTGHTNHVPHHLFPGHVPGQVTPNLVSSNTVSPAGSYSSGHGQFPPSYHPASHAAGSAGPPSYVYQQLHHYDANSHYTDHTRTTTHHQGGNQRPREGPAGANLFIYHLPHDLTDADLATAFNPFGNVISAKVYVDRFTGESKGFGFVSYDSIISAEHAIEQMNGFQIGNKRLKVQHKRVNHRPPVSVPAMHHPYYTHGHAGPVHHVPVHDVPPAIEISGPSVGGGGNVNVHPSRHGGGVYNGITNSHLPQNLPQSEVDILSSQFEALNTQQQMTVEKHQQH